MAMARELHQVSESWHRWNASGGVRSDKSGLVGWPTLGSSWAGIICTVCRHVPLIRKRRKCEPATLRGGLYCAVVRLVNYSTCVRFRVDK